MFERVVIVGLGCIGASVGLAIRTRRLAQEVVGIEREPEVAQLAQQRGAVDAYGLDLAAARHADLLVLAVPPLAIEEVLVQLAPTLSWQTILTDVASVKVPVLQWVEQHLPMPARFVGGHPIAGSERSGPLAAQADLFADAYWILTPTAQTDPHAVEQVRAFITTLGAIPMEMEAAQHDHHFALLSHLPHILANLLVRLANELEYPQVGGRSWRDLTRVAGSNPELWKQILLLNRSALRPTLERLQDYLGQVGHLLDQEDEASLEQFLQGAPQPSNR